MVGLEEQGHTGVMATTKAIALAREFEMDLVEIVANQVPPVCKVVEFSKFRFEQKKREKEQKAKQAITHLKEIRFVPIGIFRQQFFKFYRF